MDSISEPSNLPVGPGIVSAIIDLPFFLALPNGSYKCLDPVEGVALIQIASREGCTSFFRDKPLVSGPTSFLQFAEAAKPFDKPRMEFSYLFTSVIEGIGERAVVNINTKKGFSEAKYFTEAHVYFITDMLEAHDDECGGYLDRATQILNSFLDKYRVVAQDYRVHAITPKKSLYLTICHVSLLKEDEKAMSSEELIDTLFSPREWEYRLGSGAINIFQPGNSYLLVPQRATLESASLKLFTDLAIDEYAIPLSYSLILEADKAMLIDLDFRLAIVHAATAIEVHIMNLLHALLVADSRSSADAWHILENNSEYSGAKRRAKKLEQYTKNYCEAHSIPVKCFLGTALYDKWDKSVGDQRNRAVHAGKNSFTRNDAFDAILTARQLIAFLESRIPAMSNKLQLDGSMNARRLP